MVYAIAFATFCSALLSGSFALRLKDKLHLILGFAAGAVVGVAFFDLIPEALELAPEGTEPHATITLIAFGFALYLLIDRFLMLHTHSHEHGQPHGNALRGSWNAGTLSFHSFLDGLGVGIAFQASPAIGAVVATAVIAHGFSDGINTVSAILRNGGNKLLAVRWLMINAAAPVTGIVVGSMLAVSEQQLAGLLAFFAGFFLYIGASDLLPESHHAHPMRWTTIATLFGMAFIYVIIELAH